MLSFLFTLQAMITDRIENNDKGATAVEYGLMVALITVGIVASVVIIGDQLAVAFDAVADALVAAA